MKMVLFVVLSVVVFAIGVIWLEGGFLPSDSEEKAILKAYPGALITNRLQGNGGSIYLVCHKERLMALKMDQNFSEAWIESKTVLHANCESCK